MHITKFYKFFRKNDPKRVFWSSYEKMRFAVIKALNSNECETKWDKLKSKSNHCSLMTALIYNVLAYFYNSYLISYNPKAIGFFVVLESYQSLWTRKQSSRRLISKFWANARLTFFSGPATCKLMGTRRENYILLVAFELTTGCDLLPVRKKVISLKWKIQVSKHVQNLKKTGHAHENTLKRMWKLFCAHFTGKDFEHWVTYIQLGKYRRITK